MLNIKNHEAHELARKLAAATGESMTRAVITALRERLVRVTRQTKKPTATEILDKASRIGLTGAAPAHGELLYDEHGLPK